MIGVRLSEEAEMALVMDIECIRLLALSVQTGKCSTQILFNVSRIET